MNSVFALVSIFTCCVLCKVKEYASRFNSNDLGQNSNNKKMQNQYDRGSNCNRALATPFWTSMNPPKEVSQEKVNKRNQHLWLICSREKYLYTLRALRKCLLV